MSAEVKWRPGYRYMPRVSPLSPKWDLLYDAYFALAEVAKRRARIGATTAREKAASARAFMATYGRQFKPKAGV